MLEFRRKIIDFGVRFAATTFRVSKFGWSNFDEKSSIFACFVSQLPSACRNCDARISTKNHRFWRAFCRNYLRRVEIWMIEFRRKLIDFGVLFSAIAFRVSNFSWWNLWKVRRCCLLVVVVAKRRFSTILDSDLHLFLSATRSVDDNLRLWVFSSTNVISIP